VFPAGERRERKRRVGDEGGKEGSGGAAAAFELAALRTAAARKATADGQLSSPLPHDGQPRAVLMREQDGTAQILHAAAAERRLLACVAGHAQFR